MLAPSLSIGAITIMSQQTLRRAIALIIFVAFSIGVECSTAKAQHSDDFDALYEQLNQLYQAGKYGEASRYRQTRVSSHGASA
jgi:outer membrane protein assembly factor BamD (BamD/ComL family)